MVEVAGFAPVVTRTAMLLVASFALLGLFRLAETVANREVAFGARFARRSILCSSRKARWPISIWPPPDLPSGACTAMSKGEHWQTALWFSLAALAKETAILAPLALFAWDFLMLRALAGSRDGSTRQLADSRNLGTLRFCFRFCR